MLLQRGTRRPEALAIATERLVLCPSDLGGGPHEPLHLVRVPAGELVEGPGDHAGSTQRLHLGGRSTVPGGSDPLDEVVTRGDERTRHQRVQRIDLGLPFTVQGPAPAHRSYRYRRSTHTASWR
ncbi:MAG: hypothetical protein S0880_01285 [Actinomycetota bacterium]|nr:hypothetical protein [Actinomycetota bacterium]